MRDSAAKHDDIPWTPTPIEWRTFFATESAMSGQTLVAAFLIGCCCYGTTLVAQQRTAIESALRATAPAHRAGMDAKNARKETKGAIDAAPVTCGLHPRAES
jgi:hypothetical protein